MISIFIRRHLRAPVLSQAEMTVGEYPCWIEERADELVVHFQPKTVPSAKTFFNLRFRTTDKTARARIRRIFDELSRID